MNFCKKCTGILNVRGELSPRFFGSLKEVGESVYLEGSETIANLTGLESLSSIGGDLRIGKNKRLVTLDGIHSLKIIGEKLRIFDNDELYGVHAKSLTVLGGGLYIANNKKLSAFSLDSLSAVVGSNFRFVGCPSLIFVDMPQLEYLEGYRLGFHNNGNMTEVLMPALKKGRLGDVSITGNRFSDVENSTIVLGAGNGARVAVDSFIQVAYNDNMNSSKDHLHLDSDYGSDYISGSFPLKGYLAVGTPVYGDTREELDYVGNSASDAFYLFTPNNTGSYTLSTCGSKYDTWLRVFTRKTGRENDTAYNSDNVDEIASHDDTGSGLCSNTECTTS